MDYKTEEKFWEIFWEKIKLPQKVDYNFKNDRIIAENFTKFIPKAKSGQRALEIGCAPGKWMVLFNKELGYNISGIEYVEVAAKKTIENFHILDIPAEEYDVQVADFFKVEPSSDFDVVFSLGFIEHFNDWEMVIDKHLKYCKPNSYLVLGLPNFRGINYSIQKIIDNNTKQTALLPIHNLKIMDLKLLRGYAESRNLDILKLDYVGGFEPGLFNTDTGGWLLRMFLKITVKIASIIFGSLNHRATSSYIFCVFKLR